MLHRSLVPRPPWAGRRVVLGVTGGIAAYKTVQLARDLTRLGASVDTIMTRSAGAFVAPLTFQGVTGREVYRSFLSVEGSALHLRLGAEADVVVVAPATADLIARAAHGRSNDLLTAVLLSTRSPVLLAPAMNDSMYAHPQTERNLEHCRDVLGHRIIGPAAGPLAAGEGEGAGRMLEPEEICEHVGRAIGVEGDFEGRTVLVTAGPTREPIDPIRFVGNRSSGRMGFALAREAWLRGANVTLITGPSVLTAPVGVSTRSVETAEEMLAEVSEAIPAARFLFFSAAVSDFRPLEARSEKIKRSDVDGAMPLTLVENPDVALETRNLRHPEAVTVGFALETEELGAGATKKLKEKEFDLVVANDPLEDGAGFDVLTNRVTLYSREGGEESLPLQSKEDVAREILDRVRSLRPPGG